MRKPSTNQPGGKPDARKFSKDHNLSARESYARKKASLGKLKKVLNLPEDSFDWQAVGMAAETISNQPSGGSLMRCYLWAASAFLEPLEYSWGLDVPVDTFWKAFIELVEARDSKFARALLSSGYDQHFRWLLFGHVQRLETLYYQRPEAHRIVEIYENSEGKMTSVAVCNNGDRHVIEDDHFDESPRVGFPGENFTLPMHPDDAKKLENMPVLIYVPTAPEPRQPRPTKLLRETVIVNVFFPTDLAPVAERMNAIPFPSMLEELRRLPDQV